MSRIDALSASTSGPGASDSISFRPPILSRGSTASASTMIPIPPSHWLNWRHMAMDLSSARRSVATLEPVVVIPDMPSKYASTGRESCSSDERTYGSATTAATTSHVSATTRKPSRAPTVSLPSVTSSSPKPSAAVIAPAATNGQMGSE